MTNTSTKKRLALKKHGSKGRVNSSAPGASNLQALLNDPKNQAKIAEGRRQGVANSAQGRTDPFVEALFKKTGLKYSFKLSVTEETKTPYGFIKPAGTGNVTLKEASGKARWSKMWTNGMDLETEARLFLTLLLSSAFVSLNMTLKVKIEGEYTFQANKDPVGTDIMTVASVKQLYKFAEKAASTHAKSQS